MQIKKIQDGGCHLGFRKYVAISLQLVLIDYRKIYWEYCDSMHCKLPKVKMATAVILDLKTV